MRRWIAALVAMSAGATASEATANGRYPAAQFFAVGEGEQRARIALVTTFGLVTSVDGGRQWSWVCEDAVGFTGQFDPAIAVMADGTLVSSLPDGLSRTNGGDWCQWSRPAGFASDPVTDVSNAGATIVAAVSPPAQAQYVSRSNDHGATWARAWARPEFYMHTIDVAPSRPSRVYVTGWVRGAFAALFRSDDGGGDFVEATRDFSNGYIAFLSWVDPLREDTLLVRADLDPAGTLLMRSDDGATSFRTILRSATSMIAVAAEPGTQRLWASSTAAGERIQRSEDGGSTWTNAASTLRPRSMRYVNGTLFATAAEMTAGMSFACSRDKGESWTPMLTLDRLRGPEACPEGSTVRTRCAGQWEALRAQLTAIARPPVGPLGTCDAPADAAVSDGSVEDATADAAGDGMTAADAQRPGVTDAATDGGAAIDAGAWRAGGGCSCAIRGGSRANSPVGLLLSALGALFAAARRGRSRRHCVDPARARVLKFRQNSRR
jgi:hypothetical protein